MNERIVVGFFLAMAVGAFVVLKMLQPESPDFSRFKKPDVAVATIQPAPVAGGHEDPGMIMAIAEARRRWPEFVAAFQGRENKDSLFIVKVDLGEGDKTRLTWMAVTRIESGTIVGIPEHAPGPPTPDGPARRPPLACRPCMTGFAQKMERPWAASPCASSMRGRVSEPLLLCFLSLNPFFSRVG